MKRSGYTDDVDNDWEFIRWRGQVASAIRGKRGQAFLRELIAALDALPLKKLVPDELQVASGEVCALGAVGLKRGVDMSKLDSDDHSTLASVFGIAHQLIQEIEYENDEIGHRAAPEQRWLRMRNWAERHLIEWEPTPPQAAE
jgi:hypothetical protein